MQRGWKRTPQGLLSVTYVSKLYLMSGLDLLLFPQDLFRRNALHIILYIYNYCI